MVMPNEAVTGHRKRAGMSHLTAGHIDQGLPTEEALSVRPYERTRVYNQTQETREVRCDTCVPRLTALHRDAVAARTLSLGSSIQVGAMRLCTPTTRVGMKTGPWKPRDEEWVPERSHTRRRYASTALNFAPLPLQ